MLSLANDLRSISCVAGAVSNFIVVGTNLGVYVSASTAIGTWSKLGSALPNVIAYDMEYDTTDDILVVGTMGRGSWSLSNVTTILESTVDITLGFSETFIENGPAIRVAPAAKVTESKATAYGGTVLTVAIGNSLQTGDLLDIVSQGTGAGEISVVGTQVAFGGTTIGVYSGPGTSINVTFNTSANRSALEKLLTQFCSFTRQMIRRRIREQSLRSLAMARAELAILRLFLSMCSQSMTPQVQPTSP